MKQKFFGNESFKRHCKKILHWKIALKKNSHIWIIF